MDCQRTHTLTLSVRELRLALQEAFPHIPLIAAIPDNDKAISVEAGKFGVSITYKSTVPLLSSATDLAVVAS